MRYLPNPTFLLLLLLAVLPTRGHAGEGDAAPHAPATSSATLLPFDPTGLEKGLVFLVSTGQAPEPGLQGETTEPPGEEALPPPAVFDQVWEYGLVSRKAQEGGETGTVLTVTVRTLHAQTTPVGEDGTAPSLATKPRSFAIRLSELGEIVTSDADDLAPNDRKRLELILGAGLHGTSLQDGRPYGVGGLSLWLDAPATADREGAVVFAVRDPKDGPRPGTEAREITSPDTAVYARGDGLLEVLEISAGAGQGRGAERLGIKRLPKAPQTEEAAG